jgi:hypothetical protein
VAALRHDADLLEAYATLGHFAVRARGSEHDDRLVRIDDIFREHMSPRSASISAPTDLPASTKDL